MANMCTLANTSFQWTPQRQPAGDGAAARGRDQASQIRVRNHTRTRNFDTCTFLGRPGSPSCTPIPPGAHRPDGSASRPDTNSPARERAASRPGTRAAGAGLGRVRPDFAGHLPVPRSHGPSAPHPPARAAGPRSPSARPPRCPPPRRPAARLRPAVPPSCPAAAAAASRRLSAGGRRRRGATAGPESAGRSRGHGRSQRSVKGPGRRRARSGSVSIRVGSGQDVPS